MKHDVKPEIEKTEEQWRADLGPERFHILREAGTERAFTGDLLNEHSAGKFVCGACGAELFASDAKYDSHCGWPSFTTPQERQNVRLLEDYSMGMQRTEVRCKRCDSHLGHVFPDGPGPEGTRYCINSMSLKFVPRDA
jgi:peptide-methionine (R)-S-oxide reductase